MFFKYLLTGIAIFFLGLFIIKLFNPKVFPFLYKGLKKIWEFIKFTFTLFIKSSIYTVYLTFKNTILVIGLDIVFALLLNVIITTIATRNPQIWFDIFVKQLLSTYVFSFFIFTYLIGLYHYLKKVDKGKHSIHSFWKMLFQNGKKGYYSYDESTKQYTYHDN
ncbi:MAG: hypothetical protein GX676_06960 [Bacilli bacterium]|nr:hypothetical protein [Bacilli bacterium]